jgi:hypothetical protein
MVTKSQKTVLALTIMSVGLVGMIRNASPQTASPDGVTVLPVEPGVATLPPEAPEGQMTLQVEQITLSDGDRISAPPGYTIVVTMDAKTGAFTSIVFPRGTFQ